MESRRLSTPRGFTLLEILVVIGLIVLFSSIPLFMDITSYRGDAFRGERSAVVGALQKARADALNNINQEPHGVAFFPADHPHSYVIFEGATYAASNPASQAVLDANYPIVFTGSPSEVVFSQLSGDASYNGDLQLTDTQRNTSLTITLNHEGAILY